jgi:NTE family protein
LGNIKNNVLIFIITIVFFVSFVTTDTISSPRITEMQKKYFEVCEISFDDANCKDIISNYHLWRPKIGLALSGGGARGFAQTGVLKELRKSHIPIDYIVGTSIGAVIGGLYASGYSPDEMDSLLRSINWEDILSFSDEQSRGNYFQDQKVIRDRNLITLRFKNFKFVIPEAISGGNKINLLLQKLIWNGLYHDNGNFDNLKIPFRAVATDLMKGETAILDSGNLITAIRASSIFPLRYSPVRIDSMVLVDGGLMANMPIEALNEFHPEIIIGVSTISPLLKHEELDNPLSIADQFISITMKKFSDVAENNADIVIKPEIGEHLNTDFTNLDTLIESGQDQVNKVIGEIKKIYEQKLDSLLEKELSSLPKEINKIYLYGFEKEDSLHLASIFTGNEFDKSAFLKNIKSILIEDKYKEIKYKLKRNEEQIILILEPVEYEKINNIVITGLKDSIINTEKVLGNIFKSINLIPINLSPVNIENITEKILKAFRESGYSFVDVKDIKYNNDKGELVFVLNQRLINSINLIGEDLNDFLITREITFAKGEPANANEIIRSWENIISLDFISDVEMRWNHADSCEGINVEISPKEIGDQTIRLGARVDNERYTQLGIDLIQENLFDIGTRLSLRFASGIRNQEYILKAENSRIFNTFYTDAFSVYYNTSDRYIYERNYRTRRNRLEYINTGEFTEERYGAKFLLGTQIERKGTLSGQLRYEKQRFYDINADIKPEYYSIFALKVGVVFDTEDKTDFATQGSLVNLALESSLLSSPDAVSFSKATFYYKFNETFQRHTISPSIFFGFADESTPMPEFFNLGGQENFFGMRENELRGRQLAKGSIEYSFKSPYYLFFDTYLSLRYDLGSAWERFETIKFENLKHGIGITLGFDTPVGPAKFSLGKSFLFLRNPNAVSWGPTKGYFSIGLKL